jgi:hypothetical protein
MGATSSIIESNSNKIYKDIDCGCIYCYDEKNCELLFICNRCLTILQEYKENKIKPDNFIANEIIDEVKNKSKLELIKLNNGWKTYYETIEYANKKKVNISEFISNKNLLEYFEYI